MYERVDTANRNRANPLFDASLNHGKLSRRMRLGEIRHVTIPEVPTDLDTALESENSSLDPGQLSLQDQSEHTFTKQETVVDDIRLDNEIEELYRDEDSKLFAVDKDGKLYIYGAGETFTPKPSWQLILLTATD